MPRIERTAAPSSGGSGLTEKEVEEVIARAEKIGTTQLVKEAVTAAKLGPEAVETAKIKLLAITAALLGAEAVETGKIKLLAITEALLAAEAVSEGKIKKEAVSKTKLSTGVQEELEPKVTEHSFAIVGEAEAKVYPGFFVKLGTHEAKNLIGVEYELLEGTSVELEIQKANSGKSEAAAGIAGYKVTELKAEKSTKRVSSSKALQNEDRLTLKCSSPTAAPKGLICTLFLEAVK